VIVHVLMAIALTLRTSAQEATIPDRAAASGGKPVLMVVTRDIQPAAFGELVAAADVIVVGSWVKPRGFLSDDKRDVFTEYQLKLRQVVVDRGAFASTKAPGPTPPLTIVLYGGELMIGETRVRLNDMSLTRWKDGATLLMSWRAGRETQTDSSRVRVVLVCLRSTPSSR
jgi:hypothetical protein